MSNQPQIVALIRRVLKTHEVEAVSLLDDGCDHWAFEVNGSFIARVRKHPDDQTAAAIEREAALLKILSRILPIPLPEVVAAEPGPASSSSSGSPGDRCASGRHRIRWRSRNRSQHSWRVFMPCPSQPSGTCWTAMSIRSAPI